MKHCMAVVAVVLTAHCAFDSYRVGYVKSQVPSESDAAYLPVSSRQGPPTWQANVPAEIAEEFERTRGTYDLHH